MTPFPTPYTAEVHAPLGEPDKWGREVFAEADRQAVIGWGPPMSAEPKKDGRTGLVIDVELYAPRGFRCPPGSKVVLQIGEFLSVGYPEDYGFGPFGFKPGVAVNLRRVEG